MEAGVALPAAKEYVVGEYMKIGSDHLEWYDLKYWIDKFGLTGRLKRMSFWKLYEDEIEVYPEVEEVLDSGRGL